MLRKPDRPVKDDGFLFQKMISSNTMVTNKKLIFGFKKYPFKLKAGGLVLTTNLGSRIIVEQQRFSWFFRSWPFNFVQHLFIAFVVMIEYPCCTCQDYYDQQPNQEFSGYVSLPFQTFKNCGRKYRETLLIFKIFLSGFVGFSPGLAFKRFQQSPFPGNPRFSIEALRIASRFPGGVRTEISHPADRI